MGKALIVLASSTSAYSVKTFLEKRYKIYSKIVQAPTAISSLGCSYCLEIDKANLKTAISLIRMSTITVRGIYDSATYEKINL